MKNFYKFSITVLLILSIGSAFGQILEERSLERPYEVRFNSCQDYSAFFGAPISELHLFAYRNGQWEPIPFQFDERDCVDSYDTTYFCTHNGLLDDIDEIAFMVKDLGDKVPVGNWINDAEAQSYPRYEIRTFNQDNPGNAAWGYLFRSSTITEKSPVHYVSYDTGTDFMNSIYYEAQYNNHGVLDHLAVKPEGGGSGVNIFDRQKYRIGLFVGSLEALFTENDFILKKIDAVQGPIRVMRKVLIDLQPPGQDPWLHDQPMTAKFFPHYLQYSGEILFEKFAADNVNIEYVRQSLDFNAEAIGMKFHSTHNQNILIDGTADSVEDTLEHYQLNWMMATGNQGTVLAVNDFTPIGSSQTLFYKDSKQTDPTDTGDDKKSYGEMGVQFKGYRIKEPLKYKAHIFFLPGNQEPAYGDKIQADFANPVGEHITEQGFQSDVAQVPTKSQPKDFQLSQNFPNPFNPATSFEFELPQEVQVKITIMNLLGQKIKTLVDQHLPAGRYHATWHGDNDKGSQVATGIYFYMMESGSFRDIKKMILVD